MATIHLKSSSWNPIQMDLFDLWVAGELTITTIIKVIKNLRKKENNYLVENTHGNFA